MKLTRRFVLSLILGVFLAAISLGDSPATGKKFLVFVGTYTDKTDSKGIYAYEFDTATSKLTPRGLAAETPNPSWIAIHPKGKFLYSANESATQSTVSAFSIDGKTEGPAGYADWVEAWSDDYGLTAQVDACVLGGRMYPSYEQYWTAIHSQREGPRPPRPQQRTPGSPARPLGRNFPLQ